MSLGSFSYKSFGVFSTVDSSLWIKIFPTLTPGWIWRTASCKMSPEKRKRKGLFSPQTWHFEEEKVPNNSSFGTFLPYFETIHRFNKKNVWGITYVCTERIFDSGPFMYSKIFLKTPLEVASSHLFPYSRHRSETFKLSEEFEIDDIFLWKQRFDRFQTFFQRLTVPPIIDQKNPKDVRCELPTKIFCCIWTVGFQKFVQYSDLSNNRIVFNNRTGWQN